MKAREWFKGMDNYDLLEWAAQYGRRGAGFYPRAPRRACYAEMSRRGLRDSESTLRGPVEGPVLRGWWKEGFGV